jgi:hypothetical protein
MATRCPNKQHESWKKLVSEFGETRAYLAYIRNKEDIPSVDQARLLLDITTEVDKYNNQYYTDKAGNKILLTDDNNRQVWTIENSEDLIEKWETEDNGAKKKIYRKYTYKKADNLVKQLRTKYPSARFSIIKVDNRENPRLNSRIKVIIPIDSKQGETLYEQKVDYNLKLVNALQKIQRNKFEQSKLQGWLNDLQKQGVSKYQLDLFKSEVKDGMTKDEIISNIIANYSYTVEVNTAKQEIPQGYSSEEEAIFRQFTEPDVYFDEETGRYNRMEYQEPDWDNARKEPTQYYSNLTVPGGTNYTENEIKTPNITPSIKGHAQFATDQGIGWFRSDDERSHEFKEDVDQFQRAFGLDKDTKKATKTRRILEIQSDLFQKGRDKEDLVKGVKEIPELFEKSNQFLQLLNKDNNWVTFFIKSIIQDSAKKGYEKVLFPKGETAAKIEGHETIAEEIKKVDQKLQFQRDNLKRNPDIKDRIEKEIAKLEQEKANLKSQGIEKLKPIEAFYEIKVGNILKKQYSTKEVTDEYGNGWWEIELTDEQLKAIELQQSGQLGLKEESIILSSKKMVIFQNNLPINIDVEFDASIKQRGLVKKVGNKRVIVFNPSTFTSDTVGHEFGHILIDLIGGLDNPLVKRGLELLKDTSLAKQVREVYKDKSEDIILHEILAQAIGERTVEIFNTDDKKSEFLRWLERIFRRFKELIGIEEDAVTKLSRMLFDGNIPTISDDSISEEFEQRDAGINPEDVEFHKERIKNQEIRNKQMNHLEEMKEKMIEVAERKRKLFKKRGLTEQTVKMEKLLDTLNQAEDLEAILSFITDASKRINRLYKNYLELEDKQSKTEEPLFDVKTLYRWRDSVSAYDIIEEFRDIYATNKLKQYTKDTDILSKEEYKRILVALDTTIANKNILKKLYIEKGLDILSRYLSPQIVPRIEAEFRKQKESEYNKLSESEKTNLTLDKFISDSLAENEATLRERAELVIRNELKKASKDINLISRWLDNILDTPDVVVSAMVKTITLKHEEARLKSLEFRDKLIDIVRELEEKYGNTIKDSPSDIYDFMLEKDEKGNYTQHYITEYKSKLMDEYNKVLSETSDLSDEDRRVVRKRWLSVNAPLDYEQFNKAKQNKLSEMIVDNKISASEANTILENDVVPYESKMDISDIISNEESADEFSRWINENIWKYRNPSREGRLIKEFIRNEKGDVTGINFMNTTIDWHNNQWSKFKKFMDENPNDPRTKFYNFVVESNKIADKNIPWEYRLGTRLPGIMKDINERVKSGQKPSEIFKATWAKSIRVAPDDIDRGQLQLTNEAGEDVSFLPIYYTNHINEKDQSYDLASLYYRFYSMSTDYAAKSEILPEMELAKYFVDNRDVIRTDSDGNPIKDAGNKIREKFLTKEGRTSFIAGQLNDWFESIMYGKRTKDEGVFNIFGLKIDKAKAADLLNKYTSFNLLSLNFVQGTANVVLGETMQRIETYAKQYLTTKDYKKGRHFYDKNLSGILGDIGSRKPENIVSLLLERFDVLNEYSEDKFRKNTKFRQLLTTNSLFFTSHAGEHFIQTRFLLGMLSNKKAYDNNGNEIGSMLDLYEKEDKEYKDILRKKYNENWKKYYKPELRLPKEVNLEKSNWNQQDQILFGNKVRGILAGLHGEYSDLGRTAVQRYALGRMAILFRKFVVPGFKRRWAKEYYNSRIEDFVEGNYRTTGRFIRNVIKDMKGLQLSILSNKWEELTNAEKSNIIRTVSEVSFLITATILANVFLSLKGEADDDFEEWFFSFASYQLLRYQSELLFFIQPYEAMKILRSPAASMSVIENTIKLTSQIFHPFELYDRGPFKGQPKIKKTVIDMIPAYKQLYKLRDIEQQLNWWK